MNESITTWDELLVEFEKLEAKTKRLVNLRPIVIPKVIKPFGKLLELAEGQSTLVELTLLSVSIAREDHYPSMFEALRAQVKALGQTLRLADELLNKLA